MSSIQKHPGLSLKLISQITSQINSNDDINTLLQNIMEITKNVLNSEGASLLLYDKEKDALVFNIAKGEKGETLSRLEVPRGKGIAGSVLETLKPEIVNDASTDDRVYKNIDKTTGFVTKNLICVPMIAQDEVQGVLEAVNTIGRDSFSKSDVRILTYLSDLAAISIRNRLLIDKLDARAKELDCLFQLSQSISTISNIDDFLSQTVKTLREILNLEGIILAFRDEKTKAFQTHKGLGLSSEVLDQFQKEEWEKIFLESSQRLYLPKDFPNTTLFRSSMIATPVFTGKEANGVLIVADRFGKSKLDESDMPLLRTIANQIGDAFNASKIKEQKEKLKAVERDMQVASQIQRNSLPQIPNSFGNLEIASFYKASRDIGGDFYDMVIHGPNEVSFIIADVSGKGTPAALFMELSKTVISSEVARISSTSHSLQTSNHLIQEKSGYFMFVTVMLMRIDMNFHTIRYSSAGHNEQLLYRSNLGTVERIYGKGMPLGIAKEPFGEYSLEYEPGDILFLYTDGVTECMNENHEEFTVESVVEILEQNAHLNAEEIKRIVLQKTTAFQGNAEQHDDFTFLVIKL